MNRRQRKRLEFQLTALSILTLRSEMLDTDLYEEAARKLNINVVPLFLKEEQKKGAAGRAQLIRRSYFVVRSLMYMRHLEKEGYVTLKMKLPTDPATLAEFPDQQRMYFSINNKGSLRRRQISELLAAKRPDLVSGGAWQPGTRPA